VSFLDTLRNAPGKLRSSGAGSAWRGIPDKPRKALLPLVALILIAFYPFYRSGLAAIPGIGHYFPNVGAFVVMLVFTMMAVSLNVVVGYAGLLDLGYVAFYAIGAYTVAVFASTQFGGSNENPRTFRFGAIADKDLPGIHISIWLMLIIAAVFTALLGVLIGLPTLRLRGDYLAIVTLGFGEILPQVARNGDDFFGTGFNLTGGSSGVTPVDPPGFGSWVGDFTGGVLPENFRTAPHSERLFYWTALALLLITIFCCTRLRDSRLGRAWIAIREDETAAAAMGIPLMRTKTWAYAVGAFFGGLAGGFFASFKNSAFESDFFFQISVFILCMVILGGMGNVWGVVVGGLFLSYLDRYGISTIGADLGLDIKKYTFLIFGIILLGVMLLRPEGIFPESRRKAELKEGVEDTPLYDIQHEGSNG
jgi:branched-chain amino acid transport system permease protein